MAVGASRRPGARPRRDGVARHRCGETAPPRAPRGRLGECRGRSPGSRVWAVAPRLPGRLQWHREARARRLQLRGQPRRWGEPAPRSLLIPSVGAGTLTRRAFDPPPPPVKPPRVARGRSPEAGSAGRRSSPAGGSGASASRRWQHCARAARRRCAGVGVARKRRKICAEALMKRLLHQAPPPVWGCESGRRQGQAGLRPRLRRP